MPRGPRFRKISILLLNCGTTNILQKDNWPRCDQVMVGVDFKTTESNIPLVSSKLKKRNMLEKVAGFQRK